MAGSTVHALLREALEGGDRLVVDGRNLDDATIAAADLSSVMRAFPAGRVFTLRHATVVGDLDLAFEALPSTFELQHCRFDKVRMAGTDFRGLSLRRSSFAVLFAPALRVAGWLDLEGVRCGEVDLSGAQVGGSADLGSFRCPGPFRLDRARIDGELFVSGARLGSEGQRELGLSLNAAVLRGFRGDLSDDGDRFVVHGGVSLERAQVTGQVRFDGAQLHGYGGPALVLDNAKVGHVRCTSEQSPDERVHRFEADGELSFLETEIAGVLDLRGAILNAGDDGDALTCDGLSVGNLTAEPDRHGTPTTVRGAVRLDDATVHGNVWFADARIESGQPYGAITLQRASITRELSLRGAQLTSVRADEGPIVSVLGERARVGTIAAGASETASAVFRGRVVFADARLDGVVDFTGARVDDELVSFGFDGIHATRLVLRDVDANGALELAEARVSGEVDLSGARFTPPSGDAVIAPGATLGRLRGGKSGLRCFTAHGAVRLETAKIERDVSFDGASITGRSRSGRPLSLVLDRAELETLVLASQQFERTELVGQLRLAEAVVHRTLDLRGASVTGGADQHAAIVADGARCSAVNAENDGLDRRFSCRNGWSMNRATVSDTISLLGAELHASALPAFSADGARFGALLAGADHKRRFEVTGEIRLVNAVIAGQCNLEGAKLEAVDPDGEERGGRPPDLDVFSADGATFGDLFMGSSRDGAVEPTAFEARGTVRLNGARVEGQLTLSGAELRAWGLGEAFVADGLRCGELRAAGDVTDILDVAGGFHLSAATIDGDLDLRGARIRAIELGPALDLRGTTIGGVLDLDGAEIVGAAHEYRLAIDADALTAREISCRAATGSETRFTAEGLVSFSSAAIAGRVDFSDARVDNPGSTAVSLRDASIKENVVVSGATLAGAVSLDLDGSIAARLTGQPRGRGPFSSLGELRLVGAKITDGVFLDGARLEAAQVDAISADRASLGTLSLRTRGSAAECIGCIRLLGAHIVGQATIVDARLRAAPADEHQRVFAADDTAFGELWFLPSVVEGTSSVLGARARRLLTHPADTAVLGDFDLAGFSYERWDTPNDPQPPSGWQLTLVERSANSSSSLQGYERLAHVLREQGDEASARRALLAREKRVTGQRATRLVEDRSPGVWQAAVGRVRRTGYVAARSAYRLVVGYGYEGFRPVIGLFALWLAACGLVVQARSADAIVAKAPPALTISAVCIAVPLADNSRCAPEVPRRTPDRVESVSVPVFAAERVLPAIDLGERIRVRVVGWYAWGLATITIFGWILTLALIAALNKTLRRD